MDATTTVDETTQVTEPVVEEVYIADPTKHAFVTWVILGDDYVTGALVLGHSIKKSGSKAALVVMVSSDVSEKARGELKAIFDQIIEVPVIDVKVPQKRKGDKDYDAKIPFFSKAFTKLNALKLTQFEKIALLDADQLCVANPDNIFKIDAPAGICTALLRAADGAHHGQPLTQKHFDSCYKESGIRGCTYLLKPSEADFEKAIKMITVKPKIVQYKIAKEDTMSVFSGSKSAFAVLDDSEDEADFTPVKAAKPVPKAKTVRTLTAEELATTKFEDDVPEPTYPYTVLKLESAPLGFAFGENKKSMMGPDEILFADLYKNQWKHLHNKFGHTSWKKNETSPVFMHFTSAQPWKRTADWPDYEVWDAVALDLVKVNDEIKSQLLATVPYLKEKEAIGSPAPINPPAPAPKKAAKKVVKKDDATATAAPVAAVKTAVPAVQPVDEVPEVVTKPVIVPAPAPAKNAWGAVAKPALGGFNN